jgi:ORF6N domain
MTTRSIIRLKSQFVTPRSAVPAKRVGAERVERRILSMRGQKVMLSPDLAELYEVAPKVLVQAVKRNRKRFPADFMFQLTRAEYSHLKSQFVTSSWGGARRAAPYAFTEQGVAMLSSVLRSPRAIQVNIAIMRAFVKLREILATHRDLARRLDQMESKYDAQFRGVFDAIRQLMMPPEKPRRRIGFVAPNA